MIVIFVLLVFLTYIESKPSGLKYTWIPDSAQFDFMVGISYRDVPVCSGILTGKQLLITAATPLRYHNVANGYVTVPLHVHVIYREWDKNFATGVQYVNYQRKYFDNSTEAFEKSGIYGPLHDLAFLTLIRQLPTHTAALAVRHPIYTMRDRWVVIQSTGVFTIVGHGYADRLHVQQNIQLEAVDYLVKDVLVDCDEWVPRPWGFFVCLLKVDNCVGISSGAALLYNDRFFAIGSFSLTRGNETLLLLTDMRKYKNITYYYNKFENFAAKQPMWL